MPSHWARPAAIAGACLTWIALTQQAMVTIGIVSSQGRGLGAAVVVLLSFFTILTNLLVAMTWLQVLANIGWLTGAFLLTGFLVVAVDRGLARMRLRSGSAVVR